MYITYNILTPVIIIISRRDRCSALTFCRRRGRYLGRNRHLLQDVIQP